MNVSTILKWVTGACEALLAIPLGGAIFIISSGWSALLVMFILHLVTLIFSIRESRFYAGSILGLVTSAVGAIPFIGWVLHTITAIILLVDAGASTKTDKTSVEL